MEFYFSGVASAAEFNMLQAAGVSRILVDPFDLKHVESWTGKVALDCGAYKRLKEGKAFPFRNYVRLVEDAGRFSFVTAYDVIGDQAKSRRYWRELRSMGVSAVPVWHWGSHRAALLRYLDEAPVVGIGGMVNILRAKGKTREETKALQRARAEAMNDLTELCARHNGRFHLYGACWLRALEDLRDYVASADSSKWLDGRRQRLIIFENTSTHHLSIAPSRALGYEGWDGTRLSIENAKNMEAYLNCGNRQTDAAAA